jgi:hypothetical protein
MVGATLGGVVVLWSPLAGVVFVSPAAKDTVASTATVREHKTTVIILLDIYDSPDNATCYLPAIIPLMTVRRKPFSVPSACY